MSNVLSHMDKLMCSDTTSGSQGISFTWLSLNSPSANMNFSTGFTGNRNKPFMNKDPNPPLHDVKGKTEVRRILSTRFGYTGQKQQLSAVTAVIWHCVTWRRITSPLHLAYLKQSQWHVQATAEVKKTNPAHTCFIIAPLLHRLEHKKINKSPIRTHPPQ